ncbi:outer membrane protein assembly factor [Bacteroidota bacterium]
MILRIKIFFLLIYFPTVMNAQVVDQIEVNDNVVYSDNEILFWIQIGNGTKMYKGMMDTIKSRITYNLNLQGYFNPDLNSSSLEISPDSQKVNLSVSVVEGEPSYIKNVYLSGTDSLHLQTILPLLEYLESQVFNKYEIEQSVNEILLNHENEGYPFSVITITSVYLYYDSTDEKNYTDLYLQFEPGPESRIDKVEVRGNESTEDYVIIRELRIEEGEKYSQEKVDEFPKRLNRLRFFEPVSSPRFYLDSDDKGILQINLKERQTNNFDGIIGYLPPANESESGYITGLVNVSLRNLFGTGRAAAFRWRKIDRNSQELEIKYLEPWLFSFPLNVNLSFFQRQQDTIYVQRTFTGEFEYLATEDVSAGIFITSESTIPTLSVEPVFTVYNSSALSTGVNLKIDTRDDPFAPTEGIYFLNSYKFSKKTITGPEQFITSATETELNLQRFEATVALFYELFVRQVIALEINGKELRGPSFEESDLFRLGGTNSLRGYREDQFLGNRIFWSNLEYRFFLTRRTFAFLFFDSGYYLRNEDAERGVQKLEEFKTGYGLGLNLETAIGILSVSFALAQGDSFSDGKIHFGIVNEF